MQHKTRSDLLEQFLSDYAKCQRQVDRDRVWDDIKSPIIEPIVSDNDNCLVTFLYRHDKDNIKSISVYILSSFSGLPLSQESKLFRFRETDIFYLSVKLPSKLRTAYYFVLLDESVPEVVEDKPFTKNIEFPKFIGNFKKSNAKLMHILSQNNISIDQKNDNKIVYYMDFENPDKFFGMESILELPMAPTQKYLPVSFYEIKEKRNFLMKEKRFSEYTLSFKETSLKNVAGYKDETELFRKYWVYLPPGYNTDGDDKYPLMLFLDGSDYVSTIPTPSMLDSMIADHVIPPTIAVYFEYSSIDRAAEYYCDDKFTSFLAKDLIQILTSQHQLNISIDPKTTTIIGLSASGLAAFYAGLMYPDVFGNVITQSAAFWSLKKTKLEELIDKNTNKLKDSVFILESGCFEDTSFEYQFSDGSVSTISLLESNKNVFDYMNERNLNVHLHEFVGGHNYVCYRSSLPERFRELYDIRLVKSPSHAAIQNTIIK